MSVSNIASGYSSYQTSNNHQQRKQEFEALQQALQSGDLSGAQQAFSQLQQNAPGGSTNSGNSGDGVITDISALGQALSANDLSSAQSAFSTLQTDFKNNAPLPPSLQNSSASDTSSAGDTNNSQSLFEQLVQALQSGDLSAAQNAFTSLQSLSPDNQTAAATSTVSSSGSANTTNPLDTDLSSLGDALQKGDLSGAQSAFQNVLQDFKSNASHHHHHGVHNYVQNDASTTTDTNTSTTSDGTDTSNSSVSVSA